ncbi:UPF0257 lipoprotein YnfC [Salmonella enterica subsp. enterica serovar Choleraesuis]|nr:UPF0257 lipoprotein YnfC [Salmonella enterica subsp. enterica serovar Choleraesuis]
MIASALVLMQAGICHAQTVPPFSPIMSSFSNELDFDALRGHVRRFEQTLYDQNQLPLMVARGEFDAGGCLTRYQRVDNVNQQQITLVRDESNRALVALENPAQQIHLTDKCQIASTEGKDDIHRQYIYQKNLLVKVKDAHDGYVYKEYFYTPEAMPKIVVWYSDDSDVLMLTEPKKRLSDPWDFVTQGYDNGHPVYQAFKKCHYDNYANPTGCALIIDNQGGAAGQTVQEIRYSISYYH